MSEMKVLKTSMIAKFENTIFYHILLTNVCVKNSESIIQNGQEMRKFHSLLFIIQKKDAEANRGKEQNQIKFKTVKY